MKEELILVDENDLVIGVGEKIHTHTTGALHRAFSIFIFNSAGELLLQKRSRTKYHSRGLWSNTCCGHPRPGESIEGAGRRRLGEEMGFDCELKELFEFTYQVKLDDGFSEHEYDHVLVGTCDEVPSPNQDEVDAWKWADVSTIMIDMEKHPQDYTYWFKASFDELCRSIKPLDSGRSSDLL